MQEFLTHERTYTHKHKHKHTWHKPALHFRHVEVLKKNIKDMYEYSYAVCQDCQDYGELRSHSCYGWLTLYPHKGAHYYSSIMPGIIKHKTFSLSSHWLPFHCCHYHGYNDQKCCHHRGAPWLLLHHALRHPSQNSIFIGKHYYHQALIHRGALWLLLHHALWHRDFFNRGPGSSHYEEEALWLWPSVCLTIFIICQLIENFPQWGGSTLIVTIGFVCQLCENTLDC